MDPTVKPYSVSSYKFWKAYFITMRPYLLFVSGAAALVGLSFIQENLGLKKVLAFIPLFFSYGLGQALTDSFQTDTDSLSSPYRPLVRNEITVNQVLVVSLAGLTVCVLILAALNPFILFWGLLSVTGLLSYTFFKKRWWGGPPWNAWIVALLPIIARYVSPSFRITEMREIESLPFGLTVLGVFFAYANFVVMGYFKDISADRKTGYRTFPVVFGWTANAVYSDLLAFLAALSFGGVLYATGEPISAAVLAVYIITIAVNVRGQLQIHWIRDEARTYGPIAQTVRSFILYCLTVTVLYEPGWLPAAVIFYLLFEGTLMLRPEKKQI